MDQGSGYRSSPARMTGAVAATLALLLFPIAAPAAFVNVATGVGAGVGIAADPAGGAVYYVEWNGGTLRRLALSPPECTAPACAVTSIATGLAHPQDVALDTASGFAYVTTRDDVGTTGSLWRVALTPPHTRTLVTFNLGAPHQIALDPATDTAWVVGYDAGILWKITLSTGSKVAVATGLLRPIGLAVNAARTRAYVTEETPQRVNEIDLATGVSLRTIAVGATPFYLAWADPTQASLYVVRRGPRDLYRVDLPTSAGAVALSGLPVLPSGVALNPLIGGLFVAADAVIVRDDLGVLPATEPVFLGVGNIPSTSIDRTHGYATTAPTYFFRVTDAPFGGTLNLFGNFTTFSSIGTHYRVMMSSDGGLTWAPLRTSWTMYRWNIAAARYDPATIAPDADGRYAIPPEYPATPHRLYPVFLMMQWPSGANGLYRFMVEVYQQTGATFQNRTHLLPAPANGLTLRVDNTSPDAEIVNIFQHGSATPVSACAVVTAPVSNPARYDLSINARDPNGHLLSYHAVAYWENNKSSTVIPTVSYAAQDGPRTWYGVTNLRGPMPNGWPANCNCAHTFRLRVTKRTTNGYNYVYAREATRSITVQNTGVWAPCPAPLPVP